jgi:hypothetical protein
MNDIDERDRVLGSVLDRAVRSMEPAREPDSVLRRGARRRAFRLVASVTSVSLFVAAVAAAAIAIRPSAGPSPGAEPSTSPPVIYRDDARGFSVTYPGDWFRADQSLTPSLAKPVEILSLATYPLERTPGRLAFDAVVPGAAANVDSDGIFVTLQQDPGSPRGFHDRPTSFDPATTGDCPQGDCLEIPYAGPHCPEGYTCPAEPGYHAWWIPFRDQGRGFYAFVAMGDGAFGDPARYGLAWQVLDSLRFHPAAAGDAFALCPFLDDAVAVGDDAAQTASDTALRYVNASAAGDDATVAALSDPVAPANGVEVSTTAADPILASDPASDDPIVVGACGQDVADHSWRVTVDDGTASASLDTSLYLIRRSDGWKVWGSY